MMATGPTPVMHDGSLAVLSFPKYPHSQQYKGELVRLIGTPTVIKINNSDVEVQFYNKPRNGIDFIPAYDSVHAFTTFADLSVILKDIGFKKVKGLYEQ